MPEKLPVVFLAPSFGAVNNGPSVYAEYLWEAFSESKDIEFHLVAPQLPFRHPQLHQSETHPNSREQYRLLQEVALQVSKSFRLPPIIHSNTAHTASRLKDYSGKVVVQVNDYDAATIYKSIPSVLYNYGARRLASLAWRHEMESRALQFAERVVCNSKYTQSQVLQSYPNIRRGSSVVIYKSVDLDHFRKPYKEAFPRPLIGKRRILFVGSNWYRKGLDIAINALAKLDRGLSDVVLIVAGNESQRRDAVIRRLPEKLGISSRIQFLGRVPRQDLPNLFQECDVMALPSRQEALGVAVLESLATGTRVIATSVGGIPEILNRCQYSHLIAPESVASLVQKLEYVFNSPPPSDLATEEALNIADRFRKETMLNAVSDLYSDIATSRPN